MGYVYYGTHTDKATAMSIADNLMKRAKKGVCYTPASRVRNGCNFNAQTNLWTCQARAHNHEGSCGSSEIHWNRPKPGDEPTGPTIPVITWDQKSKSSPVDKNEEVHTETYSDAGPEDY